MNNSGKYKVGVFCITYNHAAYIKDAMNGFCLQETTFPFVVVIINDASPDGEQAVIQSYLDDNFNMTNAHKTETEDAYFIEVIHKTNTNCTFVSILLKYNFHQCGKNKRKLAEPWMNGVDYIAFCEGDDYWIDNKKLSKQVLFLDNNPEFGMVYTDYHMLNELGEKKSITQSMFHNGKRPVILSFKEHLVQRGYIAPMSWLFRQEYKDVGNNYTGKGSIDGSFIFALEMFLYTKVHFLDEPTCVYRVHWNSATNPINPKERGVHSNGVYNTQSYYIEKYGLHNELPDCRDWFYKSRYAYFLAQKDKSIYPELKEYFSRTRKDRMKHYIFYMLLKTTLGTNVLQLICKYRVYSKKQ